MHLIITSDGWLLQRQTAPDDWDCLGHGDGAPPAGLAAPASARVEPYGDGTRYAWPWRPPARTMSPGVAAVVGAAVVLACVDGELRLSDGRRVPVVATARRWRLASEPAHGRGRPRAGALEAVLVRLAPAAAGELRERAARAGVTLGEAVERLLRGGGS